MAIIRRVKVSRGAQKSQTLKKGEQGEQEALQLLVQGIKRQSGKDKNTYLRNICEEIETAHMQKKTKVIYDSVRKITGKQALRVRAVKDKDGVVLVNQEQIKRDGENISSCCIILIR